MGSDASLCSTGIAGDSTVESSRSTRYSTSERRAANVYQSN